MLLYECSFSVRKQLETDAGLQLDAAAGMQLDAAVESVLTSSLMNLI